MNAATVIKPPQSAVDSAGILPELKEERRWVTWRWEWREGENGKSGKWTKPPYQAGNGYYAKSNDSTTWNTFQNTWRDYETGHADGVGFMFTGGEYCGVDLDHCLNPDGTLQKWAIHIVANLASYTEVSPSGDGLHTIVKAILPEGRRRGCVGTQYATVEVYDCNSPRYFTITGQHWPGTPMIIEARQAEIDALHNDIERQVQPSKLTTTPRAIYSNLDDRELLSRARNARNGGRFVALFDHGDVSAYGNDHSRADAALCEMLAFWTGRDPQQIDLLFRRSALMRDKWNERHSADGRTYGQMTVDAAIIHCAEVYTPAQGTERPFTTRGERSKLDALLQLAVDATKTRRLTALQDLAGALANYDPITVSIYAERVKNERLMGLTDFKAAVKAATQRQAQQVKRPKPTDDELRDRWRKTYPLTRYGLGNWRRYEGGYWPTVPQERVMAEIMLVCEDAKAEGINPTSMRIRSVFDMVLWACSDVPNEQWNANPNILVLTNGTLDLDNYTLRGHNADDYATRSLPYAYDAEVKAMVFDYVLHSTITKKDYGKGIRESDVETISFLQEFAGYCLTTDTSLETAVWFYGPPGGGKSTLIKGFQTMLGDLAGLLSLAQIQKSQFSLANLPGKRLVVSTEQPNMYLSSAWILNAIVSGEPVIVEQKHKPAYKFTPYAKIVFAMNGLPRVGDASSGLFRRVKVVKIPQIPQGERDPTLGERIVEEGPGILNWALEGLRSLRERGCFEIPECVKKATNDFQRVNDKAALFVEECCLTGDTYKAQSSVLYHAYRNWCIDNGYKPQSSVIMAREWERLGFEKDERRDANYWLGVGLRV